MLLKQNLLCLRKNINNIKLHISEYEIEQVHCPNFLGVNVDENFLWSEYIHMISNKISKNIAVMYKVNNVLSKEPLYTIIIMFFSTVIHKLLL